MSRFIPYKVNMYGTGRMGEMVGDLSGGGNFVGSPAAKIAGKALKRRPLPANVAWPTRWHRGWVCLCYHGWYIPKFIYYKKRAGPLPGGILRRIYYAWQAPGRLCWVTPVESHGMTLSRLACGCPGRRRRRSPGCFPDRAGRGKTGSEGNLSSRVSI